MRLNEIEMMNDISKSNETFKMLHIDWKNCVKITKPYPIGHINNFYIFEVDTNIYGATAHNPQTMIAAFDSITGQPAAFIELRRFPGSSSNKNIFEELVISSEKKYRGLNLITKMYSLLIKEEKFIIISDSSHSYGGRSVWMQLEKEPGISIFGYNTETKKVFQVDVADWFNEDVYDEGISQEIDDLESEQKQLEMTGEDENREEQIQNELNRLYDELENAGNTRLFATKK